LEEKVVRDPGRRVVTQTKPVGLRRARVEARGVGRVEGREERRGEKGGERRIRPSIRVPVAVRQCEGVNEEYENLRTKE
jgi:hypothetical protein